MTQDSILPLDIITIEQSDSDSILKTRAEAISFPLTHENRLLITAMRNKLFQLGGVGLAAPQVKQNKQIIAIYISEDAAKLRVHASAYPMHIMINPSYEPVAETVIISDFEGCYSVASKSGKVPRHQAINLTYQDEDGQLYLKTVSGFYARVLQHEIDHLNGILITDRLTPDCVQGSTEAMMALRYRELSAAQKLLFDQLAAKKRATREDATTDSQA